MSTKKAQPRLRIALAAILAAVLICATRICNEQINRTAEAAFGTAYFRRIINSAP